MTPAQKLAKARRIFNTTRQYRGVVVFTDAFLNLEGAIHDIEFRGGRCDKVSMNTLRRVSKQLGLIGQILESE